MKRIGWMTDLHLDFLSKAGRRAFIDELVKKEPELLLVGGDTATASLLEECFREMARRLPCPICFVLGNHDFYGGSLAEVQKWAASVREWSENLFWLPNSGIIELTPTTALIGHDGWADGRLGNYATSQVMLNDFFKIKELCGLDKEQRLLQMHTLGDAAARYAAEWLPRALQSYQKVVFLTHVPPFRESCWHEGNISNNQYLPFFSSGTMGDVLRSVMRQHLDRDLLVLCGHTHGIGTAHILPNLTVLTGGAEYGEPMLQRLWHDGIDDEGMKGPRYGFWQEGACFCPVMDNEEGPPFVVNLDCPLHERWRQQEPSVKNVFHTPDS